MERDLKRLMVELGLAPSAGALSGCMQPLLAGTAAPSVPRVRYMYRDIYKDQERESVLVGNEGTGIEKCFATPRNGVGGLNPTL